MTRKKIRPKKNATKNRDGVEMVRKFSKYREKLIQCVKNVKNSENREIGRKKARENPDGPEKTKETFCMSGKTIRRVKNSKKSESQDIGRKNSEGPKMAGEKFRMSRKHEV